MSQNLSIIVIGRNEGWRLMKCFDAVSAMKEYFDNLNFEVIYVDSKSSDGSIRNVHERFPFVKVLLVTGDCNAAIGRNIGAKEAHGDILIFLDGDMEIQIDYVERILDENNNLKYPFCNGIGLNVNYTPEWEYINETDSYKIEKDTFDKRTGGFFVIERWLWEKVGGMDNRFIINEDVYLGLRMSLIGYPVLRYAQVAYRHHTIPHVQRKNLMSFNVRNRRFPMIIVRETLFKRSMFRNNMTRLLCPFALFFSVLLSVVLYNPMIMLPYLIGTLCRTVRESSDNICKRFFTFIGSDSTQFYSFFCFYPSVHREEYKIV